MKKYELLKLQIINFDIADVICASIPGVVDDMEWPDPVEQGDTL